LTLIQHSTTPPPSDQWWSLFDNAEVTYRWETGMNPWNRTVSIIDSNGRNRSFDKPLQFKYSYTAGDDPNGDNFQNGAPFLLEYGGPVGIRRSRRTLGLSLGKAGSEL
jgi:hypothetical protein